MDRFHSTGGAALIASLLFAGVPAVSGAADPDAPQAEPTVGAPKRAPPSPSEAPDAKTDTAAPPPPTTAREVPAGQWAYTKQYGWAWLPYAGAFVSDGAPPKMFLYTASTGWSWVSAPWVAGEGARPVFSVASSRWPYGWRWGFAASWRAGMQTAHARRHVTRVSRAAK
ncbi:MAG: hypothetical protein QM723_18870 [Myxococcaceae bacterium]